MEKFNLLYLTRLSLVAAMGGLLFGYDWVVIGGAKPFYEQYFGIASNTVLQGWAVSCALVGCVVGAVTSGILSKKLGRKRLLLGAAFMFLVSAVGTGLSNNFTVFILYRILGGIGIGLASNQSPVYIAEISPARFRGRLVSINQLTIVIGILLAQVTNWFIAEQVAQNATATEILNSWNGQTGWRYMFWAEAIPSTLFFLLMFFVPDSPRWLVGQNQEAKASTVLQRIGGSAYAQKSLSEIKTTFQSNSQQLKAGWSQMRPYFSILIIGIVLAVFQQWCGINVIFLYADEVFTSAGYSVSGMLLNVVITGSVNLIFTIIAISLVDRIGRKALLLIGSGGLAIIYLFVGAFYYLGFFGWPLLLLIVLAIACYALTLAPVTWVVLSEIFPNRIRGVAMAISTFALWVANTMLAFFFPIVNEQVNAHGSFWLFAGICIAGFFFIRGRVTETKGKSLEAIEKELI
jgi:SP family sugar porter-like MFS transporter